MTIRHTHVETDRISASTLTPHHSRTFSARFDRTFGRSLGRTFDSNVLWTCVMLCAVLLLAACGPEAGASGDGQEGELIAIAQEYAATQDLAAAQDALEGIDVPNPRQFALLTAEEVVASPDGRDPAVIGALVQLVQALGLESNAVTSYAQANGLLPAAAAPSAEPLVVQVEPIAPAGDEPATGAPQSAPAAESAETERVDDAPAADEPADEPPAEPTAAAPTEEPTVTPEPTATPDTAPKVEITSPMNVRGGPSTDYTIVGGLQPGEVLPITGKNAGGDWWRVELDGGITGWVFGGLVQAEGDINSVAVITDIAAPPPPPEPVAEVAEPAPEAAAETPPEEAVAPDKPHFSLVERRLWSKQENGGCAGQHLLRINVIDANGNRLNGVRLQGIYIKEILVTGAQGKGDGIIEYDLHGSGEGFRVINDVDGREATSDSAEGFTTRSMDIDKNTLIGAGYCSDSADCDVFYSSFGCLGHHSWEATFQRNY